MNKIITVISLFILAVALYNVNTENVQAEPLHMVACYMPNNTQEYHYFEYTVQPTYDLCMEIGGTAY